MVHGCCRMGKDPSGKTASTPSGVGTWPGFADTNMLCKVALGSLSIGRAAAMVAGANRWIVSGEMSCEAVVSTSSSTPATLYANVFQ